MSQSKGVLSCSQQLDYLSQWFTEFSEMQRLDFCKHLSNKYSNKYSNDNKLNDQLLSNGFNELSVGDRPPSIFECRMKLFNEWFTQWSDEEKHQLLIRLRNIDSKFMSQFDETLSDDNINIDDNKKIGINSTNGNVDDPTKQVINEDIEDIVDTDACDNATQIDNLNAEPIVGEQELNETETHAKAEEVVEQEDGQEVNLNANSDQLLI